MFTLKNTARLPAMTLLALSIAACNGGGGSGDSSDGTSPEVVTAIDVDEAALITAATKTTGGVIEANETDYAFPALSGDTDMLSMSIPAGPAPAIASRRTVSQGSGEALSFGDVVTLKYDMFRWSDGALVDSSEQYNVARTVLAGDSESQPVPDYLAKSLLGRSLGDVIQIVLPAGTDDLPAELDESDAHVLVVELL